jgi:hypothetical protein
MLSNAVEDLPEQIVPYKNTIRGTANRTIEITQEKKTNRSSKQET